MQFPKFGLIPWLLLGATPLVAQINAGTLPATPSPPFKLTKFAQFDLPWRIAFLPDGRMLITEKIGKLGLSSQAGPTLGAARPVAKRARASAWPSSKAWPTGTARR